MTKFEVTVAFTGGKTIEAACALVSDRPFKEDVAFSLAASMDVTAGSPVRYEQAAQYDYLPPVRKVVIEGSGGQKRVDFEYRGEVGGWGAAINDSIRCLNYQSAWRPFELNEDVSLHINRVKPEKGWLVISGILKDGFLTVERPVKEKSLSELTSAYGLFIVNTEKCVHVSGETLSAYCVSPNEESAVKEACRVYDDILAFYHRALFPPIEGENRVLISLSEEDTGGYFTPDVIVLTAMPDNMDRLTHLLAHEVAHGWCVGAPIDWNDWLNETTAEWSALLWELDRGNKAFFERKIEEAKSRLVRGGVIKTPDGSRPPDVHYRGVLLFYLLCKVYGEKAVARLLTIFQQLPMPKTTEKYLAAVRDYNADIARDIEKALEMVVF